MEEDDEYTVEVEEEKEDEGEKKVVPSIVVPLKKMKRGDGSTIEIPAGICLHEGWHDRGFPLKLRNYDPYFPNKKRWIATIGPVSDLPSVFNQEFESFLDRAQLAGHTEVRKGVRRGEHKDEYEFDFDDDGILTSLQWGDLSLTIGGHNIQVRDYNFDTDWPDDDTVQVRDDERPVERSVIGKLSIQISLDVPMRGGFYLVVCPKAMGYGFPTALMVAYPDGRVRMFGLKLGGYTHRKQTVLRLAESAAWAMHYNEMVNNMFQADGGRGRIPLKQGFAVLPDDGAITVLEEAIPTSLAFNKVMPASIGSFDPKECLAIIPYFIRLPRVTKKPRRSNTKEGNQQESNAAE